MFSERGPAAAVFSRSSTWATIFLSRSSSAASVLSVLSREMLLRSARRRWRRRRGARPIDGGRLARPAGGRPPCRGSPGDEVDFDHAPLTPSPWPCASQADRDAEARRMSAGISAPGEESQRVERRDGNLSSAVKCLEMSSAGRSRRPARSVRPTVGPLREIEVDRAVHLADEVLHDAGR